MISIVMAYYNRRRLLQRTLKTISESALAKDCEVIIVDDGSAPSERIEDLVTSYPMRMEVIRIETEKKTWLNSCVPYNIGFSKITGDKVIIQNPENLHLIDILSHVDEFCKDDNYLSYSCYALDRRTSLLLDRVPDDISSIVKAIRSFAYVSVDFNPLPAWYNHGILRPKAYHFLSAITKKNLDELNGFDERYANALGYDDDELVTRIKRKGLRIDFVGETASCVHQWHDRPPNDTTHLKNKMLFENATLKEEGYRVNNERDIL